MINQKEMDLLIDLVKLIKKYGPDAFEELANFFSSREKTEQLSLLLKNIAITSRSISQKHKENGFIDSMIPPSLSQLKVQEPKKFTLLVEFYKKLQLEKILPSNESIKKFSVECGFSELKFESREEGIQLLIDLLIKVPEDQLRKNLGSFKRSKSEGGNLEQWSKMILNG